MKTLTDADLTYLELDAKYDKPLDRKLVLALIDEVQTWRQLGEDPDEVSDQLSDLEHQLMNAHYTIDDLRKCDS